MADFTGSKIKRKLVEAIFAIVFLALLYQLVNTMAPSAMGNTTPVIWVFGVNIGFVFQFAPWILAAVIILAIIGLVG